VIPDVGVGVGVKVAVGVGVAVDVGVGVGLTGGEAVGVGVPVWVPKITVTSFEQLVLPCSHNFNTDSYPYTHIRDHAQYGT
jgi:hypothetical protein